MSKPRKPNAATNREDGKVLRFLVSQPSPAVVQVHRLNRSFDFSFLLPLFPEVLVKRIAITLGRYFDRGFASRTVGARFRYFKELMSHIAADSALLSTLQKNTKNRTTGDAEGWNLCLNSWFNAGLARYGPDHLTSFGETVNGLRQVWNVLRRNRLVPTVKFPKMPSNYHLGKGRKPSLIEVKKREGLFVDVIDIVKERARELGAADDPEIGNYLRELSEKVPSSFLVSREAYLSAMTEINRQLLATTRQVAQKKLVEVYEKFKEGERLASTADEADVSRVRKLIQDYNDKNPVQSIAAALQNVLLTNKSAAQTTAVLLAYFKRHGRGVIFRGLRANVIMNATLNKVYNVVGGAKNLTRMLGGDPDAAAAAMLMYMVDSGANPSVAAELTPDCMQPCDDRNQVRVDSIKGRAGWGAVVYTFDRREPGGAMTVPQALEMTLEMTSTIREGFPEFADVLFLFRWFEEPSVATTEFLSNRFSYLIRDSGLDTSIYRLESIRQSFILDRTLAADGNTRLAELVAAHKKNGGTTTNVYTDRLPVRLVLSKKVSDFQQILELDLLFNGAGLEEALGVTKAEAKKILEQAERTGYGIRCRNAKSGEGPTSREGEDCNDVGAFCLDCRVKLLSVDEAAIRDIVRQKSLLEAQQFEQEANATLRWEAESLPLLAFYIAAIEKLKRSPHAALLQRVLKEEALGGYDARK